MNEDVKQDDFEEMYKEDAAMSSSAHRVVVVEPQSTKLLGVELFFVWILFTMVFMNYIYSHFVLAGFISLLVAGVFANLVFRVTWMNYVMALVWAYGAGYIVAAFGADWITIVIAGIVGLLVRMAMLGALENNRQL